ncbi:MAG: hypothetical protein KME11_02930 [Timaviella obliquedivisa GSE-PSE-MK23-08B]|nr:hypothetical protein [Timaviella obliquedivisa GSE-PSE-MK23-08B]
MPLPFNEVAQDLAQEQNLVRIKKLLIYSCTQVWESDRQRLDQVSLLNLLQDLRAIAPTVEQLQSRLDFAVHSLSKAAEYTLVSNVIISRVGRLYPNMGTQPGLASETMYRAIAQRLEQNVRSDRIKKLLFLACKGNWVTDPAQLAQVNLADLVRDLHGLTPSLITLQAVLESLVNTLSKRAEYALASNEISTAFQPLYPEAMTEIRTTLPERGATSLPAVAETQETSQSVPSQAADLSNLFDLRLEIMRYTNPYRAKIVLFSLLHQPFSHSAEQESMVKIQTLDDLLRAMLETYKLSEVQVQLLAVARNMEDAEDCVQAAHVILRAVKPFYAHLPSSWATVVKAAKVLEDATAFIGSQAIAANPTAPRTDGDDESAEGAIVLTNSISN